MYEGNTIELGCDSYPGVTPLPEDDDEDGTRRPSLNGDRVNETTVYSNDSGGGGGGGADEKEGIGNDEDQNENDKQNQQPKVTRRPSTTTSSSTTSTTEEENSDSSSSSTTTTTADPQQSTLPGFNPTPSISPIPSSSPSPSDDLESPDPDDAGVCVDAAALSAVHPSHLVFPSHRRAAVLCDPQGSCATPGHMVVFQGRVMTMRLYCEDRCERRVMWVNSPRMDMRLRLRLSGWRRGNDEETWSGGEEMPGGRMEENGSSNIAVRVKSRTEGLFYTALAARFESRLEIAALRILVRLGA